MSSSTLAVETRRTQGLARAWDYLELTKPKIALLELVTVAVAAFLASVGSPDPVVLLHTLAATALVAAGASALNQWLERRTDAKMPRTADRPLPGGRLGETEVLAFGWTTSLAGVAYLALAVNGLAAALALSTWGIYVWIYTPLKVRTPLNTVVGAVAGALPVLIGWAAMGGRFGLEAATLFMVVFLWQFPHFMAIAWMYRHDYAAAGMKMASVVDPTGRQAGRQAIWAALALAPVTLAPALTSFAGPLYCALALLLSAGQLLAATAFMARTNETNARRLLRASLIYLPGMLLLMMTAPLI